VYHLYVIRTPRRDRLLRHLTANGVDAAVHYPVPAHRQPPYADAPTALPLTEAYADELLSLPIYPELGEDQVARVAELVREFFSRDD
jgi:dTDP-4-amino-4,6-dideoxygalactose transaminase